MKKCNKTEPCDDCPFRKKCLPGWLGPNDVEYFEQVVELDYPYPCHQTIEKPNEHICVGMVHTRNNCAKKSKILKSPLRDRETQLRGVDNDCFGNMREFREHHAEPLKTMDKLKEEQNEDN